ncbi:sulfurtransferase [Nitrospina gracilis]|uniref:sulfurtransferase n=1 Tax=Nitrospina gracilis TaxID=35801 RepID=UPI001F1A78F6|nr:rhodanese-like domain-containing protein [Nitrospina gracilis]MCF8720731.1 thiosulfate/3-mercaptopyruvate sulfurtransferase [Nitrospina gracilis Nb-211]
MSRKIKALATCVGLAICLICGASATTWAAEEFAPLLTINEFRALPQNEVVLLDTRSAWRYLLGHIPGAQPTGNWQDYSVQKDGVPGLIDQNRSAIARKLKALGVDRGKTLVLYGDPADKWRTDGRFFWMLEFYGFTKTALLEGGLDAWEKQGLPVERGTASPPPASQLKPEDIQFNWNVYADQHWIADRLNTPELALIDNRERHEYNGATPYGSSRGGHIPGAIHIDWREFFDGQGRLKAKPVLESLLARWNITKDKEVVVYCTGGVRSGMAYFVFRHLGYNVRNYDGSWWDWSRNSQLPVES